MFDLPCPYCGQVSGNLTVTVTDEFDGYRASFENDRFVIRKEFTYGVLSGAYFFYHHCPRMGKLLFKGYTFDDLKLEWLRHCLGD